jgi:hypothetical protein
MHLTPHFLPAAQRLLAACGLGLTLLPMAQAQTDALLDFRIFNVPQEHRSVRNPLQVRWLVREDAQSHCDSATPKDGHVSRPEGCVYWQIAQGLCTLVTTASTTHSQLGHLYLHCLNGQ